MNFSKFLFFIIVLTFLSCQTTQQKKQVKIIIKKPIKIVPKKEIEHSILDNKKLEDLFFSANEFFDAKKYDKAFNLYEKIVKNSNEFSQIGFCYFNMGLILQKRKEYEKAAEKFKLSASKMQKPSDKKDALFLELETLRFVNKWKKIEKIATSTLNNSSLELSEEAQSELKLYLAESLIMSGKEKEGKELAEFVLFSEKRGKTRSELIYDPIYAMAEFVLGRNFTFKFQTTTLEDNIKSLENKCRFILKAQEHYLRAIKAGVLFWTNASAYEIANLYLSLYNEMSNFPVPEKLNDEEKKVYKCELWKKTENLLKKSRRILKKSISITKDLDLENEYTVQSFEKILEINEIYDKKIQECKTLKD